jgi:hypothetical protein
MSQDFKPNSRFRKHGFAKIRLEIRLGVGSKPFPAVTTAPEIFKDKIFYRMSLTRSLRCIGNCPKKRKIVRNVYYTPPVIRLRVLKKVVNIEQQVSNFTLLNNQMRIEFRTDDQLRMNVYSLQL